MKRHRQKLGMTLIEVTVVVGIIAALVGFGIPAVRALFNSIQNEDSVRMMIDAALNSARSMAVSGRGDVGVRFQMAYDRHVDGNDIGDTLAANQYMILVEQDANETDGRVTGFRAMVGQKPIRLPDRFGVMDFYSGIDDSEQPLNRTGVDGIDSASEIRDVSAFTIVFSKTGKLDRREVYMLNAGENDRLFNTKPRLDDPGESLAFPPPVFLVDVYGTVEVDRDTEFSRSQIFIYERDKLRQAFSDGNAWAGYLEALVNTPLYVPPYAGRLLQTMP